VIIIGVNGIETDYKKYMSTLTVSAPKEEF